MMQNVSSPFHVDAVTVRYAGIVSVMKQKVEIKMSVFRNSMMKTASGEDIGSSNVSKIFSFVVSSRLRNNGSSETNKHAGSADSGGARLITGARRPPQQGSRAAGWP
jgi:hypothetical protein